jgi:putative hemin transport protein
VQIHTGPVGRISITPHWLNVRDPSFHLRLRSDRIAEAWVVRKPTVDGTVSALELYDAEGDLVAQLFGARRPGHPEPSRWRTLLGRLGSVAR